MEEESTKKSFAFHQTLINFLFIIRKTEKARANMLLFGYTL